MRQGNAETRKGICPMGLAQGAEKKNTRTNVENLDFLSLLFQNRARCSLPMAGFWVCSYVAMVHAFSSFIVSKKLYPE